MTKLHLFFSFLHAFVIVKSFKFVGFYFPILLFFNNFIKKLRTSKMGTKQHMEKLFVEHASNLARVSPDQVKEETLVLRVLNRDLVVKRRFGKVSLFTFNDLCAKVDYSEVY